MDTRVLPLLSLEQVLFPGTTLPIRLWEGRHRKLARDAVRGDRQIGIVYLPAEEASHEPKPGHVGCLARIVSARRIPDKQVRLVLEGVERFAIKAFVASPEPYPVAEVTPYEDFVESPKLLSTFAEEVRKYYERYQNAAGRIAGGLIEKPSQLPSDPVELSMTVPSLMRLDEDTCQRFLASRSPLMRLRELSAVLSPAASTAEASAEVHQHARGNGHGAADH